MADTRLWCSVCGGTAFRHQAVIWDALATDWQLAPHERAYVDRQQGSICTRCGCNLRTIALANAMRTALGELGTLLDFARSPAAQRIAILEINEAGNLSALLQQMPGRVLASYPAADMQALPFPDDRFDLVVHSDTLEHVPQPVVALAQCRRVLRPGGVLCCTVPVIVGRLSRSRAGLPPSYHGNPASGAEDYRVQTEFGADVWTYLMQAGFESVRLDAVDYPSAIALSARKTPPG